MGSSLVFQFLDINVLNYCYFHTDCLMFFINKKRWKNKKNVYYNYVVYSGLMILLCRHTI